MSEFGASAPLNLSVSVRDHKGRFLARYEERKRAALRELSKAGAKLAVEYAPKRTHRLANSISSTSGTSGCSWSVSAPWWPEQEWGSRPHTITGDVTFFWQREGRMWNPGTNDINHPGTIGVHFMQRSYKEVAPRILDIMRTK